MGLLRQPRFVTSVFVDWGLRMTSDETTAKQRKFSRIIVAYPFALIALAFGLNLFAFGVQPAAPSLPTHAHLAALSVSISLLLANHIWLMTSTELTRLRHNLHATPEEWQAAGTNEREASDTGRSELKRRHNAHTNATENTVYFALLALPSILISASSLVIWVWFLAFAVGRLGHAFSYLTGKDGLRGLFMTVSLTALFGMASYLAVALFL